MQRNGQAMSSKEKRRTAKHVFSVMCSGICVAVLLLTASYSHNSDAAEQIATVKAAIQTVTLTGYTRARNSLPLSAETEGRIETVYVDIGDVVPADGRYACLDTTYIDLDIEKNKTDQVRLKADLQYFSRQVKRYKRLVREKSSAQSQLDDFVRQQTTSRQQLAALEIGARRLSEKLLRHCMLAPPGWHLTGRVIEPGQWVVSGQQVGTVGNYNKVLVPFSLSPVEFEALQQYQSALLLYFPDSKSSAPAVIERISPAYDPVTRKRQIDLVISQSTVPLRGGIRVLLKLKIADRSGAVMVPATCLTEKFEEFWLTRENGESLRVVYLGKSTGENEGDQDWVRINAPSLVPGDRVRAR